eukprot:6187097-Pleurochrysis_carterae.AAC.2
MCRFAIFLLSHHTKVDASCGSALYVLIRAEECVITRGWRVRDVVQRRFADALRLKVLSSGRHFAGASCGLMCGDHNRVVGTMRNLRIYKYRLLRAGCLE